MVSIRMADVPRPWSLRPLPLVDEKQPDLSIPFPQLHEDRIRIRTKLLMLVNGAAAGETDGCGRPDKGGTMFVPHLQSLLERVPADEGTSTSICPIRKYAKAPQGGENVPARGQQAGTNPTAIEAAGNKMVCVCVCVQNNTPEVCRWR